MMEILPNKIDYDIPFLALKQNRKRAEGLNDKIGDIILDIIGFNYIKQQWLDDGKVGGYMRELLLRYHPKLAYTDIDLDTTPYPYQDSTFNIITSLDVIEHLYNPLFHLLELHRVLSPDGILVLNTANDYSLIYKVEHLLSRKYKGHFHQFSEFDLRCILERAGSNIISFKKYFSPTSGTIARISRKEFIVVCKKIP